MDPRSTPHFIQLDAPERLVFSLAEGKTTLGRDTANDFCLPDSSISREHCYFEREGGVVRVFDCNSKNPTCIGKERVDGEVLSDGDVLRLGRSRLLFKNPLASPKEQAPVVAEISAAKDTGASGEGGGPRNGPGTRRRKWRARLPRHTGSRSVALIIGAVLLVAVSVIGGIVVGRSLLDSQSSGISWNGVFGGSDRFDAKGDVHLSRRLQMIEELLGKQADEIGRMRAELESNRVRFENLPLNLQNEIEFYQRQNDDRQGRELARVSGQLDELRSRVSDSGGSSSPRAVTLEELGLTRIDEPWNADVEDYSGRTRVAKPSAERKKLGARRIRDLVAALQQSLGEYAMPGVTPDILQPHLGELSSALGKTAAKGAIEVYDHGRDLLRDIDTAMGVREKWVKGLLKKAEGEGLNKKGEGSASKKGGRYGPMKGGKDYENEQRLLELSAKKVAILTKQRRQLVTLQHAVLDSLMSFTDPESTAFLADRFSSDDDRDLRFAILKVLADARAAHSVPKLTLRLRDSDEELRASVHRTLVAIAGEDLGEKAGPWREWWAERKEG